MCLGNWQPSPGIYDLAWCALLSPKLSGEAPRSTIIWLLSLSPEKDEKSPKKKKLAYKFQSTSCKASPFLTATHISKHPVFCTLCWGDVSDLKGEFVFCTSSLIIRMLKNVPWHYYENRHSPESWRMLLMSPLTENNTGADNPSKNRINTRFKRLQTRWIFSGVLSWTDTETWS